MTCFVALDSNRDALKAALSFAHGKEPFVLIHGAGGWGKSHLLRAAADLSRIHGAASVETFPAESWLTRGLTDSAGVLALDDIHLASTKPKCRALLMMKLERRLKAGRPTICVANGAPEAAIRKLLPQSRRWRRAAITRPSFPERITIVRKLASNTNLDLSDLAVRVIARTVEGDGHSLAGAVRRIEAGIDKDGCAKLHPVRVAGLLNPFLIDHTDYDLRDVVIDEVVRASQASEPKSDRDASKLTAIAVYILSREAMLSEESIAAYFGIRSASVYRRSQKVAELLQSGDKAVELLLGRVLRLITQNLCGN